MRSSDGRERTAAAIGVAILVLEAAIFCAFNLNHGHHPTDDGWLLAYGWRIIHGEVPYRDFFWAQPPVPLYLASLWMHAPDGWQFKVGRFAFYAEMTGMVAMPLWFFARTGRLKVGVGTMAVIVAAFALALHNFPAMPWSTVDGLLFGSAAVTAFSASLAADGGPRDWRWRAIASAAAVLAAFCKQGFALVTLLLGLHALVEAARARSIRPLVFGVLPGVVVVGAILGGLAWGHALGPFLRAVRGSSQQGALLQSGVDAYLRPLPLGPVAALVFGGLGWLVVRPLRARVAASPASGPGRTTTLALLALATVPVALATFMNTRVGYRVGVAFVFMGAGAAAAWLKTARRTSAWDAPTMALGAGALVLCWCASISYGYQTPILGVGVLGVFLAVVAPSPWPSLLRPVAIAAAVAAVALVMVHQSRHPYREAPRALQTGDLGTVYPRLGHLTTGARNVERYAEIKELSQRYALSAGRPFAVVGSFPLIYFLSDRRSPTSVDWFVPAIVDGHEELLLSQLTRSRAVALVERGFGDLAEGQEPPSCQALHSASPVVEAVMSKWRFLHQSHWFCVYDGPAPG